MLVDVVAVLETGSGDGGLISEESLLVTLLSVPGLSVGVVESVDSEVDKECNASSAASTADEASNELNADSSARHGVLVSFHEC